MGKDRRQGQDTLLPSNLGYSRHDIDDAGRKGEGVRRPLLLNIGNGGSNGPRGNNLPGATRYVLDGRPGGDKGNYREAKGP